MSAQTKYAAMSRRAAMTAAALAAMATLAGCGGGGTGGTAEGDMALGAPDSLKGPLERLGRAVLGDPEKGRDRSGR